MHVYRSSETDIFAHLAFEEYLLNNVSPEQRILYIWKSHDAIVIGKNQNPWSECLVYDAQEHNIAIARRLSGGGTVFHDEGNLNFTFISSQNHYNFDVQIHIIQSALLQFGIKSEIRKNNIITTNGKKCSGNAFCHRKKRSLHHGTLLINSNLDKIIHYLHPSTSSIKTHAIASNSYPIINLTELNSSLTFDAVAEQIITEFCNREPSYEIRDVEKKWFEDQQLNLLIKKYRSEDWTYYETPAFEINWERKFSWDLFHIKLKIHKGQIANVEICSDALDDYLKKEIKKALTQSRFGSNSISSALSDMRLPSKYQLKIKDMCTLIKLNPL